MIFVQIDCPEEQNYTGLYDAPSMEDFLPAWKLMGLSSIEEGFIAVFSNLQKHKDSIISRGFSKEVLFGLGDNALILKGKNEGRKKDKS